MQQVAGGAGQALVGRMLGPYRLEAFLGRGGMSSVYRATQTTLDRPVALKLLPAEFARDQVLVSRFLQEARAAAALQHPHIIPIYDSGQAGGQYYIAMRYIDGVPLSQAIPETGLPVARAVAIIQQLASALDYAHARGIVHRDVSAGNVMLEPGDRVTLMDFGIAQARQGSRLTRAGVAVGTLEYLSPEQARGDAATPQSDVYSLGVLTYELLTGRLPFSAADDRGLLLQHLNAPPPPVRRLRPDVPAGVDGALARCLAKDPSARFPTAGAFAAALSAAVAGTRRPTAAVAAANGTAAKKATAPSPRPSAPPRKAGGARMYRRHWRWWTALVALALVVLLVAGAAAERYAASLTATGAVGPPNAPSGPSRVATVIQELTSRVALPAGTARQGVPTTVPTPKPTTAPTVVPAVHPSAPTAAVQGYYTAIFDAIRAKDPTKLALAYAYLSPQAQAQLPYDQFVQRYAPDTGLEWSWSAASRASDGQSATVPVQVTEYRGGSISHESLIWNTVSTPDGWRLVSSTAQAASAPAAPDIQPVSQQGGHPGRGKGHGKGD